jgi:predicted permease
MTGFRYALRSLRRSPGFTGVAILSLALGLGANAAIYSVIRRVMLDPLPVPRPDELVAAYWNRGSGELRVTQVNSFNLRDESGKVYNSNFSYPLYRAFRDAAAGAADVFAFNFIKDLNVAIGDTPSVASGALVSDNYFSALEVGTVAGRPLTAADARPDAAPAVVISHGFWMRVFGGDPRAVGRSVRIAGAPFTIVGVTPAGFEGASKGGIRAVDLTLPLSAQPTVAARWMPAAVSAFTTDERWWLYVMARVRHPSALAPTFATVFRQSLAASNVEALRRAREPELRLFPGARGIDQIGTRIRQPLFAIAGVSLVVLLLACVNLANLTLARAAARQKASSVRLALGAGRLRLGVESLTESLLLAIGGGALAIVVAAWGGRALATMLFAATSVLGGTVRPSLDWRVLAEIGAASIATGLAFGVLPAIRAGRLDVAGALGQAGRGPTARSTARALLMAAQVALSIPLLVGAVLFLRTVHTLARVDLGFEPERLLIARIDPTLNGYTSERVDDIYRRVIDEVRVMPGVASAAFVDVVLMNNLQSSHNFSVDGAQPINVRYNRVGSGFFETAGIPVLRGRGFSEGDMAAGALRAAIVNESAARQLFGGAPPLGRSIRLMTVPSVDFEVVGLAKDSRYATPREPLQPTIFLPYTQTPFPTPSMSVEVRTAAAPASVARSIREAVARVDPNVPVFDLKTELQQIDETLGPERAFTRLLVVFGVVALLLASIGLHGLTAYSVSRRTPEIGVRIALGAERRDVLWLVLRQAVVIMLAGLAVGVPGALAAARVVRATLYGVEPGDPLSVVIAIVVLSVVAFGAAFAPARRAAQMDPLAALRYE